MNIFLIILAVIGGLIAVLLLIALFTRKSYRIERSVTISKPVTDVFHYVRFLKNQDNYNKWVMVEPQMKKQFKGDDGTTGFIYGWSGSKAGEGEQEIKKIIPDKRIDMEVRFVRPFKAVALTSIETDPAAHSPDASTHVKWQFSSSLNYPANIFLLFMNVEKTLGKDVETSLRNLKTILEN